MTVAAVAVILALVIVALAVGIPYWHTHFHMRPQHDPGEVHAYLEGTGKTVADVAAGRPGRPFWHKPGARRRWQAAYAGVDPETGVPSPQTGRPGYPDGMG